MVVTWCRFTADVSCRIWSWLKLRIANLKEKGWIREGKAPGKVACRSLGSVWIGKKKFYSFIERLGQRRGCN